MAEPSVTRRPRLAVWKFSSCDGCQLALLDCENELLAVADAVEVAYFPEATSAMARGPYDLSLVEGSISTPEEAARIQKVRRSSRLLVAIGACATSGGIQALRNFVAVGDLAAAVYPRPDFLKVLKHANPIAHHVEVDWELPGCPVAKEQLLEVVSAAIQGRAPRLAEGSVCAECKRRGAVCVLVAQGSACLGPVTAAGCGGLCPAFGRGCYGCFGPTVGANTEALAGLFRQTLGCSAQEVARAFRGITGAAEAFRRESARHGT